MKAVDIIVELENDYLFIEVKDFFSPEEYQGKEHFKHLKEVLKYKYRDTFLYRWAEQKVDKPIHYLCLLTLENALISRMNKAIRLELPWGKPVTRWKRPIVDRCVVLNEARWNKNFPKRFYSRTRRLPSLLMSRSLGCILLPSQFSAS